MVLAGVVATLGGCVRYHPAPVASFDPDRGVLAYTARRLDDSVLGRVLATAGDPVNGAGWDANQLALAALYFRGELPLARAAVVEAQAAEVTAGARPYPSIEGSITKTARPLENAGSSWSEAITVGYTFELGGKRGARVARARAATLAARLRLQSTVWQLVQDARLTGITVLAAEYDASDAEAEADALGAVATLLRARYTEGQLSLAEVARADAELQTARVAVVDADRSRRDARLALARVLNVAFDRVDTLRIRTVPAFGCDAAEQPAPHWRVVRDSLSSLALRGRPDVGAAIVDYAVAEGDVRVEIARQYPDLTLGPGLLWEEGIPGWVINVGLPALILGRNRGPIAEAQARRTAQAARVRILQDSVLATVDSALAACTGFAMATSTADSLVAATDRQLDLAQAAYDRGESGRTDVALARLAAVRAHRTRRLVDARRMIAGAALLRAVGRWSADDDRVPWSHFTTGDGSP